MTETFYLYLYKVPFDKEHNFKLDNITSYINSLNPFLTRPYYTIFKPNRELTIKVDANASLLVQFGTNAFNYAMILNISPNIHYYYFIKEYHWRSDGSLLLNLEMDTLNTLIEGTHFNILDKTTILREHKNRWTQYSDYEFNRVIDRESEGIAVTKTNVLNETINEFSDKWYLVYRNRNQQDPDSPVDTFIIPQYPRLIRYYRENNIILATQKNYVYLFAQLHNQTIVTIVDSSQNVVVKDVLRLENMKEIVYVELTSRNNQPYFTLWKGYYNEDDGKWYYQSLGGGVRLDVENTPSSLDYQTTNDLFDTNSGVLINTDTDSTHSMQVYLYNIQSINDIDRTDSRLIKIIELPYSPMRIENDVVEDIAIEIDDGTLRLYSGELGGVVDYDTDAFDDLYHLERTYSVEETNPIQLQSFKDYPQFESKLLHSDFTSEKWLYDSFSCDVLNEDVDIVEKIGSQESFTMYPSSNFTSTILFEFYNPLTHSATDYDNIIVSTRNNEYPIFNSSYLNYIRNGYNFDVKAKSQQTIKNAIGLGLNAITSIASIGIGLATSNPLLVVGGAIRGSSGLVGGVTSAIDSNIRAQQNIDRKIAESQAQATSVASSDDLSIMNQYTNGNKLHILKYEPTQRMKELLLAKFHYFGYTSNRMGLPETTSRYWFNFCQADLVVKVLRNIDQDIIDDLVAKYKDGVTYLHAHNGVYDFEQEHVNLETIMMEDID